MIPPSPSPLSSLSPPPPPPPPPSSSSFALVSDSDKVPRNPVVIAESKILNGNSDAVWSAEVSSNGSQVVTASSDKTARVWDAQDGKCTAILKGHTKVVWSAGFSPNGMFVVTASADSTAQVWQISSQACVSTVLKWCRCASFSRDGTQLLVGSKFPTWGVHTVSFARDSFQGIVKKEWINCSRPCHNARFSPLGTLVTAACCDHSAVVWNRHSKKEVSRLQGHSRHVWTADFSPDATQVVTSSSDKTARVWDVGTSQEVMVLRGHSRAVYCAAFAPNDSNRVVTSSVDKTARVWDVGSGCCVAILAGHTADVNSAAFFPDGRRVVTASDDGTVRIWEIPQDMETNGAGDFDDEMSSLCSKDLEMFLGAL